VLPQKNRVSAAPAAAAAAAADDDLVCLAGLLLSFSFPVIPHHLRHHTLR